MIMIEFEFIYPFTGAGPNFWIIAENSGDAAERLKKVGTFLQIVNIDRLVRRTGLCKSIDPADYRTLGIGSEIPQYPQFQSGQKFSEKISSTSGYVPDNKIPSVIDDWKAAPAPASQSMPHFNDAWEYFLRTYSPGSTSKESCFAFYHELIKMLDEPCVVYPSAREREIEAGIEELKKLRADVVSCAKMADSDIRYSEAISSSYVCAVINKILNFFTIKDMNV